MFDELKGGPIFFLKLLQAQWFLIAIYIFNFNTLAWAELGVGVNSQSYMGQGTDSRQSSYSSVELQFQNQTRSSPIDTSILGQGLIGLNNSNFRFAEVPEIYASTHPGILGPVRLSLGRKLEAWNQFDQEWMMGAWQPRFRWDYLNPQPVGIFGAGLTVETKQQYFSFLASPVFVPDRGAPIDFADGRIQSVSPWAINPPYEVNVLGRPTQVKYDAEIPPYREILLNPSFLMAYRYDFLNGIWIRGSGAYKPMNQLPLAYTAYLSDSESSVQTRIYPRVSYQAMAGADMGWDTRQHSVSLAAFADRSLDKPDRQSVPVGGGPPLEKTSQVVGDAVVFSPTYRFFFGNRRKLGSLSASYVRVWTKDLPDVGKFQDGASQFDSRYPFQNAILAKAVLPTWRKFEFQSQLLIDLRNIGTILSWRLQYEPAREWKVYLAADVLTSRSSENNTQGVDFIYRYRANDRLIAGIMRRF